MAKRTPLPCTETNCGELFPRCGRYTTYGNHKCRCESCSAAQAEHYRRYRAKNREAILEKQKRYREANREAKLEYAKRYYRENREALDDYKRRWAAANPELMSEYASRSRAKNREKKAEYTRQWKLANPELHLELARQRQHRRNAIKKSAKVAEFTLEQLEQRVAYYGNSCYLKLDCCTGDFDHIDHVKPLSKGGPHMLANLRPACGPCNRRKGAKWPFNAA